MDGGRDKVRCWCELGPFTVFDVETTGMSPVYHRIVEIAAVRVDCDGVKRSFQRLVNPGCHIPRGVVDIHHIDDSMVADAPGFTEVGYDFLDFVSGSTLVAHNARFDLAFLQESLSRTGLPLWQGKTLDTIALLKRTHSGLASYKLQTLRSAFHLKDELDDMQAHRALSDVIWTVQLLQLSLEELLR